MSLAGHTQVERLSVSAYRIPTDYPESDGALEWDSTTLVLVEVQAGDQIGKGAGLFVDANGAYAVKEAFSPAEAFAGYGVKWFEEPAPSCDLTGLRKLRRRAPPGMEIAAGEYGYDLDCFDAMLSSLSVDVLQADVTRCGGITEFLRVGALCAARNMELSAHTAPSLHVHPCCALANARNIEYVHDHAQIEQMFFDGAALPEKGMLKPDLARSGLGLDFKKADAKKYAL